MDDRYKGKRRKMLSCPFSKKEERKRREENFSLSLHNRIEKIKLSTKNFNALLGSLVSVGRHTMDVEVSIDDGTLGEFIAESLGWEKV